GPSRGLLLVSFEALMGPPLVALGAFLGHLAAGGKSNYGYAFWGALTAVIAGTLVLGVGNNNGDWISADGHSGEQLVRLGMAGLIVAVIPPVMLELSDAQERQLLRVGVAPTRGGAAATVSVAF